MEQNTPRYVSIQDGNKCAHSSKGDTQPAHTNLEVEDQVVGRRLE
jgi:hypothetical protein